ncbi:unnamed protein product [Rotaria sp. Silwood1]|nr:unnamed protein product [Rotaria sp. Silwood1]CAF4908969.1 unnamed protein product [Rotaria sp. Silwood1]CAF4915989.1 unnamed protein product [Rotaria sp. Silwood1]
MYGEAVVTGLLVAFEVVPGLVVDFEVVNGLVVAFEVVTGLVVTFEVVNGLVVLFEVVTGLVLAFEVVAGLVVAFEVVAGLVLKNISADKKDELMTNGAVAFASMPGSAPITVLPGETKLEFLKRVEMAHGLSMSKMGPSYYILEKHNISYPTNGLKTE